jgi:plasmid maintenance system antidote protein VapI
MKLLFDAIRISEKPTYNPDNLLDSIMAKMGLARDRHLCTFLDISPATISKIRHRKITVSADLVVRIHEYCDIPIGEIRSLVGDV